MNIFPNSSCPPLEERKRVIPIPLSAPITFARSPSLPQDLIERLGIAPEKITTTHLSRTHYFIAKPVSGQSANVLRKYGLHSGNTFLSRNTWPHKNIARLFGRLPSSEQHHLSLFWFVPGPRRRLIRLLRMIEDLRLRDQVRFLGYCPAADMPGLYEGQPLFSSFPF